MENENPPSIDERIERISRVLKDAIIKNLLEHHNISWLNDEIERGMYELIFSLLGEKLTEIFYDDGNG
jgi:uncharacterized protein (DUF1786 family)